MPKPQVLGSLSPFVAEAACREPCCREVADLSLDKVAPDLGFFATVSDRLMDIRWFAGLVSAPQGSRAFSCVLRRFFSRARGSFFGRLNRAKDDAFFRDLPALTVSPGSILDRRVSLALLCSIVCIRNPSAHAL